MWGRVPVLRVVNIFGYALPCIIPSDTVNESLFYFFLAIWLKNGLQVAASMWSDKLFLKTFGFLEFLPSTGKIIRADSFFQMMFVLICILIFLMLISNVKCIYIDTHAHMYVYQSIIYQGRERGRNFGVLLETQVGY